MELAIFEDCRNLIESYLSVKDYSFKGFCVQWKRHCFQYMYAAQTTIIEVIQTTRAILHVAKNLACNRDNEGNVIESIFENTRRQFYRRVGGIFLLYAIYFKQPTRQYVKIQVTLDIWKELCEFIKSLPANESLDDVRYIFWRLYREDAFCFSSVDFYLGLEDLVNYNNLNGDCSKGYGLSGSSLELKNKDDLLTIQSQFKTKLLDIEQEYNKLKEKIIGGRKDIAQALPATKLFQHINEDLQKTIDILSAINISKTNGNSSAYSAKYQTKRKAACFIEADSVATSTNKNRQSDEESEEATLHRSLCRMSARSLFLEKLPKTVLNELNDDSRADDEEENSDKSLLPINLN